MGEGRVRVRILPPVGLLIGVQFLSNTLPLSNKMKIDPIR
jgi:hypothetical protein